MLTSFVVYPQITQVIYNISVSVDELRIDHPEPELIKNRKSTLNEKNHPLVYRFVPRDGCFLCVFENLFSGG